MILHRPFTARLQSLRLLRFSFGRRQRLRFFSDDGSFAEIKKDLVERRAPLIYEKLTPTNSYRLVQTVAPFLPPAWRAAAFPYLDDIACNHSPNVTGQRSHVNLPPGHHLVYFNQAVPTDELDHDGMDALQSPGSPYTRRLWAGGYVKFRNPSKSQDGLNRKYPGTLMLSGKEAVCVEQVRDVRIKLGRAGGEEKVYVGIERRIGPLQPATSSGSQVRQQFWTEREEDWGDSILIERRDLVFMREKDSHETKPIGQHQETKAIRARHEPQFSHSFTPTPALLFRFSALTFNAHAIHLDPDYSRQVEGHRNLLVHGPLCLTFLLTIVEAQLRILQPGASSVFISSIEYKNLAPLYVGEKMKICGRQTGEDKFAVWIENATAGVCVKGTVKIEKNS